MWKAEQQLDSLFRGVKKKAVQKATAPKPITVATYNVHYWTDENEKFALDRQIKLIKSSGADIIGLQEVKIVPQGKKDGGKPKGISEETLRKNNSNDLKLLLLKYSLKLKLLKGCRIRFFLIVILFNLFSFRLI